MENQHPCAPDARPMCAASYVEQNGGKRILLTVISTILSAFLIAAFAWGWQLNVKVSELQLQLAAASVELRAEVKSSRQELYSELKQQRLEWGLLVKALDKRMVKVEEDHDGVIGRPPHVP